MLSLTHSFNIDGISPPTSPLQDTGPIPSGESIAEINPPSLPRRIYPLRLLHNGFRPQYIGPLIEVNVRNIDTMRPIVCSWLRMMQVVCESRNVFTGDVVLEYFARLYFHKMKLSMSTLFTISTFESLLTKFQYILLPFDIEIQGNHVYMCRKLCRQFDIHVLDQHYYTSAGNLNIIFYLRNIGKRDLMDIDLLTYSKASGLSLGSMRDGWLVFASYDDALLNKHDLYGQVLRETVTNVACGKMRRIKDVRTLLAPEHRGHVLHLCGRYKCPDLDVKEIASLSENDCVICMEPMLGNEKCMNVCSSYHHYFHRACLRNMWNHNNMNFRCPICRNSWQGDP
jgi:hypothetical protein